ncbi:MAG: cytochrome c3 family protein, partial [bacterium]
MRLKTHCDISKYFLVALILANPPCLFSQRKIPLPKLSKNSQISSLLAADAPHWGNGIDCGSCHVTHQSPDAQLTNVEGNANLCMSCHNPAGLASNKPFTNADRAEPGISGTSHAWEVPANNTTHGAELPTEPEMALRIYDGNIVCSTCHNQHKQTFPPFLRATNYQNALCKDCHAIRNVGSYRASSANKGSHPVGMPYPTSDERFYSAPQNPNLPLIDPDRVECTTCHSPHYADSGGANGGAGDGYILQATNNDALCQACHSYKEHIDMGCRKCHQPHDPGRTNIFLVKGSVATPNSGSKAVAFIAETGANSFADGDSNYNGICEVCHTTTAYHRNNSSGYHQHMAAANCTECHPHKDSFLPPPCKDCHDKPQDNSDNIPPGGRRAIVAEFGQSSHHLHNGSLDKADCRVCHEMTQHMQGRVRLLDRDNSAIVYELVNRPMDDPAEAAKLVPFCLNCHDGDGDTPFSDGQTPPYVSANKWNAAAHKHGGSAGMPLSCMGDGQNFGCHATGHGSPNVKILNARGGANLETFCYNCHTDGRITNNALSGSGLANDIKQAFSLSRKHNLGTSFTVGGKSFTLQCTSCHNPHVVTGKHWDVDSGVASITRPNLSANPATNPRAMGTTLWGAASGQKMDNFAAQGSGTGGWKFNVYRGVSFGSHSIPSDQPAVYQPPKKGSGDSFEFDGDILP